MSSGELRERCRFERRDEGTNDGAGNVIYDWRFLCETWARIRPRMVGGSAAEAVLAGRLAGRSPWMLRVRYSSDTIGIVPSDRAIRISTGDAFNIKSVLNLDEKRRYVDMDAELGVAT